MQILLMIILAVIGILTLTVLFFYYSSILTIYYDTKKWLVDKWDKLISFIKIKYNNLKKWILRNWKKILGVTIGGVVIGGGVLFPRDELPPGDDFAPTVDFKTPINASTQIEQDSGVTCQVYVNDTNGDNLTVTWATNESGGGFVNKHTATSVTAGTTPSYKFTDFTDSNTKFWWKVYVNDGTVNISEIYHFTTETYRNTTVRKGGVDYFVWLGDNVSAWYIYQILHSLGFNANVEYIAVWRNQ